MEEAKDSRTGHSRHEDTCLLDPERFFFRGLHPNVYLGTASDRYAGWIGQIYSPERYEGRITSRTNRIGKQSFQQRVLPVESVQEYFTHFRVLEIDYTFYAPLIDESGRPTRTLAVLKSYRDNLSQGDQLILKVPQIIFAQKLLHAGKHAENPHFLNARRFAEMFYNPAVELLGDNLRGFVFEQEYQRAQDRIPPESLAAKLDAFFNAAPRDGRYHIELRTESYLAPPLFEVLEAHGIGQVLSHWTWLPPLAQQFARAGKRFFNSAGQLVIRLMTPLKTRYEEAYAMAHPFNRLIEGMLQPRMIDETVHLMWNGIERGVQVNVVVNNRAGGNAPLIAQRISSQFLGSRP
jgi:uncharacterized protein YecE (DUF72 family)